MQHPNPSIAGVFFRLRLLVSVRHLLSLGLRKGPLFEFSGE